MRDEMVREGDVVSEVEAVMEPYWAVTPYCTWERAGSLVVQVMVAPVAVMLEAVMEKSDGGVVSTGGGVPAPVKVATTDLSAERLTVQVPTPLQSPDQPWKVSP